MLHSATACGLCPNCATGAMPWTDTEALRPSKPEIWDLQTLQILQINLFDHRKAWFNHDTTPISSKPTELTDCLSGSRCVLHHRRSPNQGRTVSLALSNWINVRSPSIPHELPGATSQDIQFVDVLMLNASTFDKRYLTNMIWFWVFLIFLLLPSCYHCSKWKDNMKKKRAMAMAGMLQRLQATCAPDMYRICFFH